MKKKIFMKSVKNRPALAAEDDPALSKLIYQPASTVRVSPHNPAKKTLEHRITDFSVKTTIGNYWPTQTR